ncbi:hypothetical protein HHK36_023194 [Tetracentron sinense]|uniref:Leucine-rich repeat-containing N-terminal plant-type domain-containing protein n=1 Tax=Tetracentron sinense TaxID=13715 RepID=A0A834YNA3_TETSI|nr:hypothetical protein HHK36_023194 [Tetracentron sinense]
MSMRLQKIGRHYIEENVHRNSLAIPRICNHCRAKLFQFESKNLCCNNGNVNLPSLTAPQELLHLYSSDTVEAIHFRQFIRSYNSVFALTSMGVKIDEIVANGKDRVYTFRAQERPDLQTYRLLIRAENSHNRPQYNVLTVSQVAAILSDVGDNEGKLEEVILLNPTSGIMYLVKGNTSILNIDEEQHSIAVVVIHSFMVMAKMAVLFDPEGSSRQLRTSYENLVCMIMDKSIEVVVLLLSFLSVAAFNFSLCSGDPKMGCIERERQALISFKKGLKDPSNRLLSWAGDEDCCTWIGVGCNNITGHVVELHLGNPYSDNEITGEYKAYKRSMLGGDINHSLLELKHLNYLDLSLNDFGGIPIPDFLGFFRGLRYLDLTYAGFGRRIPHHLGNLSSLRYLSLRGNYYLYADDLGWLSHLSSLEHLDMTYVGLHRIVDWLQVVNTLPSLSELYLSRCNLDNIPPSLGYVNFTSLVVLDLSNNQVNYTIPNWLFNLTNSLLHLDLSGNSLQGQISTAMGNFKSLQFLKMSGHAYIEGRIPSSMWNLCNLHLLDLSGNNLREEIGSVRNLSGCIGKSLESLDLSRNQLTGHIRSWLGLLKSLKHLFLYENSLNGPIPSSLGNISSLIHLSLSNNELNGTLSESLCQLSHLQDFSINSNFLEGIITETHFANLSKLKHLDMSSNSFELKVNSSWIPPFQLEYIGMGSCILGPMFPSWIRMQRSLSYLDFSKARISDTIPTWFWNLASSISYIKLFDNQIHGEISNITLKSRTIDLSSNCLKGWLPRLSPNVTVLRLSNNSISGPLSPLLCEKMDEQKNLMILDLSENILSGELPQCWMYWQSLALLNLESNNLCGKIPSSMGSLIYLTSLHLRNNSFSGDLPSSLQNCTNLEFIDLGENKLSGNIPSWMGEKTTNLGALRLRSNEFSGNIPPQICHLTSLLILDLANNSLSGVIPSCLDNIRVMASYWILDYIHYYRSYDFGVYKENLILTTKGREFKYEGVLQFVRAIDFSSNNLSGIIPSEICSLTALNFLNLSRNHLEGKIPEKIGGMKFLQSLDLSRNHLSGEIPQSIVNLSMLSFLYLSHNNFFGRIPRGQQFETFGNLSFIGNPELCGVPLLTNCTENEEEFEMTWFYLSMELGFIIGFWGVYSVLLFKKTWRYAYFRFLEDKIDQLYVTAVLKLAWLKTKLKKNQDDG